VPRQTPLRMTIFLSHYTPLKDDYLLSLCTDDRAFNPLHR
jgi:hypothetical protein